MLGSGFEPVTSAESVVEWAALLDSGNGDFERAGDVDVKLAKALLDLPFIPPTVPAFERSLAVRNLLRAQSFLVPSGEQVAEAMIRAGAGEITPEMIKMVPPSSASPLISARLTRVSTWRCKKRFSGRAP